MRLIIKFLQVISLFFYSTSFLFGQSIRKNYNEFTPSERLAYKTALLNMRPTMEKLGCLHDFHFSGTPDNNVHNGEYFLPWHRWYQYKFEALLRSSGTSNSNNLSVPYWDWRDEYNVNQFTWQNNDFLGQIWELPSRNPAILSNSNYSLTNGSNINSGINNNLSIIGGNNISFLDFSNTIKDYIHDQVHANIGISSGDDPLFYLHHGIIDKVWQEWEELRTTSNLPKTVFANEIILHSHNASINTCGSIVNDIQTPMFAMSNVIDSRKQIYNMSGIVDAEVWYAYKGKLLLDGLGSDFITSGTKNYSYVAWDKINSKVIGGVHVGDVKKDGSNNILADNKGGFIVSNGSNVEIHAGESISFYPGFKAEPGSNLVATIINKPFGFSSNQRQERAVIDEDNSKQLVAFPNPLKDGKLNFNQMLKSVVLMNSSGEVILTESNTNKLDLSEYPKGMYFITTDIGNEKIIIQ